VQACVALTYDLSRAFLPVSVACLILLPCPVAAQRTQENIVTAAGDAFGKSIGNEKIGLYTPEDIRGFNPIDAGNARMEGLYFDQQERPTPRLINGSTVRVGITAQGYPFPAPTGIVDYRLRAVAKAPQASLELERASNGGTALALDTTMPLFGDRLGFTAGGILRRLVLPQGSVSTVRAFSLSLAWHPYDKADVILFGSGIDNIGDEASPIIFPAGNALPPKIERGRFTGQGWTQRFAKSRNSGLIAKLPMGRFRVEAGLFRSQKATEAIFSDLLRGTQSNGSVSNRVIIADGDNLDDSISGEVRLAHKWGAGDLTHNAFAALRARAKDRDFGGARTVFSGPSAVEPISIPRPTFTLGDNDQDRVRQMTYGLGYSLDWRGKGSINASLSKSRYRKSVAFANPALTDTQVGDNPWLYSLGGSLFVTKRLVLYGGYVRGLEESLVAPEIAINRGEAPPAILTRQMDAGFRYSLTPDLTLIAGAFSVRKPYYNIDRTLRFGQLGSVENRGIEISLAGRIAPGFSLIAGTVLLDPKISGAAVNSGSIGKRPVGSLRRRSVLNLDWKPQGQTRLSIDLAVESLSARIGNTSNLLIVPARTTVTLGSRYRFNLGKRPTVFRLQLTNLFNEYGWQVSGSGGFTYSQARNLLAQLVIDL
jgi:iron complex outermembrane recepter protein